MKTWNVFLRGEDRTEFTISIEAETVEAAENEAWERYNPAEVIEVYDPQERAEEAYCRAEQRYNDDRFDDYDY